MVRMVTSVGVTAIVSSPFSVLANTLTQWSFDTTANQLEVRLQSPTKPRYFLMAQPARIILDLPGATVGSVPTQQTFNGPIRRIRVSQFQPNLTRIVLELSPDVTLAPGQVQLQQIGGQGAARWQLTPLLTGSVARTNTPTQPPAPTKPLAPKPAIPPTTTSNQAVRPILPAPTAKPFTPKPANLPPPSVAVTPPKPTSTSPTAQSQPTPPPVVKAPATATPPKLVDFPAAQLMAPVGATTSPVNDSSLQEASTVAQGSIDLTLPPADPLPVSAATLSEKPLTLTGPPTILLAPPANQKQPTTGTDATPMPPVASMPPPADATMPPSSTGRIKVGDLDIPTTLAVIASDKPTVQVPLLSGMTSPSLQSAPPMVTVPPPVKTPITGSTPAVTPPVAVPSQPATPPTTPNKPSSPPVPAKTSVPSQGAAVLQSPSGQPIAQSKVPSSEPQPPTVQTPPTTKATGQNVVEFGQPLPAKPASPTLKPALPPSPPAIVSLAKPPVIQVQTIQAPAPSVNPVKPQAPIAPSPAQPQAFKLPLSSTLLPSGTILGLRYTGALPVSMAAGTVQREILLLEAEIRDSQGNLLAPAGSPVVGQFEQSGRGSRFVTQTITLRGEAVPLIAQSDVINITPAKALQSGEIVYVRLLKELR